MSDWLAVSSFQIERLRFKAARDRSDGDRGIAPMCSARIASARGPAAARSRRCLRSRQSPNAIQECASIHKSSLLWSLKMLIFSEGVLLTLASKSALLRPHFVQQSLALFQVESVEALREPAIYWTKQVAGLLTPALIAPEMRHAHRRPEFPGL